MAVYPHTTEAYREALASPEPLWALRDAVAAELQHNGHDYARVLVDLEQLLIAMQDDGREGSEEVVLDVIGFVTGFCGPRLKL
jgi:hypothetical protein